MKKIYRDVLSLSTVYAIGNTAQNVLSVILLPLYTSYLTIEDFGILALMNLTISLLTSVILSPINIALGRFYFKPDYHDKSGILLFNMSGLLIVQTVITAIVYWILRDWICRLLFDTQDMVYIVRLYAVIFILTSMSTFCLYFIRLIKLARYYVFLSLSNFLFSFLVIIYLLIGRKLGILAVIYSNIFGLLYTTLLCIPFVWKYSTFRFSPSIMKAPLKFGYPLLFSGISSQVIKIGDRYILKIFCPLSDIGLYSFGCRIADFMNVILVNPVIDGLRPVALQKEKQPEEQKQFLVNSATYYYWFGLFITLVLSIFAKEVIMVLARQKEFLASWVIVPIISFSYIQYGLGNFLGWGMMMSQKSYHITGTLLVSAAINICLNFVFIPYWGILGAAFVTLISYLFWNFLKAYYSSKFYNLSFNLSRLFIITGIGVGLYLLSLTFEAIDSLLLVILLKVLIILAYPTAFFLFPFFTHLEKDYMKKVWKSIQTNGIRATYDSLKNM